MRRPWKKLALLLGAALAAWILFAVLTADREPTYHGHKLGECILWDDDPEAKKRALLHMGTNALPYLVTWACKGPAKWPSLLQNLYDSHPGFTTRLLPRWANNRDPRERPALAAFSLLGTNAYPAIPLLNSMMNHRVIHLVQQPAQCLDAILYQNLNGRERTQRRLELLNNPDPTLRTAATNAARRMMIVYGLDPPRPALDTLYPPPLPDAR